MNPILIAKLIAIGLIVAICSYFVYRYNEMSNKINEQKTAIIALNNDLAAQNAAIDSLKIQSDAKIKQANDLLAAAKKNTTIATAKAVTIYKTLPADPTDDCRSALILGNQQ
jgi:hypothetical protein